MFYRQKRYALDQEGFCRFRLILIFRFCILKRNRRQVEQNRKRVVMPSVLDTLPITQYFVGKSVQTFSPDNDVILRDHELLLDHILDQPTESLTSHHNGMKHLKEFI